MPEEQPKTSPSQSPSAQSPLAISAEQERKHAEDFFSFYANNMAIGFSSWDVSITFGEIVGQGAEGQPVVEEIGKVTMTREFFKVITHVMALNLAAYEKRYGEIKNPHFDLAATAVTINFDPLQSASPTASPSPSD